LPAATVLSTLQRLFSKGVLVYLLPEFENQRDARLLVPAIVCGNLMGYCHVLLQG
jgi:hypothetical protein